jgi:polyisoprenyl-teichoic acid--peptidoglycan teichoic acid transferase
MTTLPGSSPSGSPIGRRIATDELTSSGSARPGFGGAVGWTVLGTFIPGLGYLRAGRRVLGGVILGLVVLTLGGVGAFAMLNRAQFTQLLTNPTTVIAIAGGLLLIALAWVTVVTTTHLSLRPRPASAVQRIVGGAVVGVLSFVVAAPLFVSASLAYTSAESLSSFDAGPAVNVDDPWSGKDQVNILILGGDSGTGRDIRLGIRPDSVSVASINTHTGAVTLINIPRQTAKMPFPANSPLHKYYPNGFYDGVSGLNQEYALNAMYRNIPARVPHNILGETKDFGASVMMVSVGEALGLHIDYHVIVNMDGFKDIINAIGGITVNVNDRVPIGGHNASGAKPEQAPRGWIEIGANQHLSGSQALWFARGRYHTTDYKRMERQQCVVNAVLKQADPWNILSNFDAIAKAGTKTISTDVPRTLFPAFGDLAVKAKSHAIHNVLLNHQSGFDTTDPDWPTVRKWVAKALAAGDKAATASATPSGTAVASPQSTPSSPASSASPSATSTTKPGKGTSNLDDACAYHPNN